MSLSSDIGRVLAKEAALSWKQPAIGAGLGGLGGALYSHLTGDDSMIEDSLYGAGIGGLAGTAYGAVDEAINARAEAKAKAKAKAEAKFKKMMVRTPLAKPIEDILRRKNSTGETTRIAPRALLSGYYENVGGLDEVISKAIAATEKNKELGKGGSKYFPYMDLSKAMDKPVKFSPTPGGPPTPGLRGWYSPLTDDVHVPTEGISKQPEADIYDHEITHATQGLDKEPAVEAVRGRGLIGNISALISGEGDVSYDDELPGVRGTDYMHTPVELDPRLAAFKRRYARDYGILIDTEEKARTALNRFQRDYEQQEYDPHSTFVRDAQGNLTIDDSGMAPMWARDLNQYLDPDDIRYDYGTDVKVEKPEKLKQYLIERILEIAQNKQDTGMSAS